MEINLNESQYALRLCVFNALNRNGDVITQFNLKDLREPRTRGLFDSPDSAKNEYFWINENTCPTNLLGVDTELYNGSVGDPHGLLILIGVIPEVLVRDHVVLINLDEGEWDFTDGNGTNGGMSNSFFFNKLIRLYKSVYHMLRNSFLAVDIGLGTDRVNPFGQVVYFEAGDVNGMSRVNWLVCEMLKDSEKYLDLIDNPKGTIVDSNQVKLDAISKEDYNGLIYGLPELLLSGEGLGIEKVINILLPEHTSSLIPGEEVHSHLIDAITHNYYNNDSVFKSYTE